MPFGNFEQEKMSNFSESIFFESAKRAVLFAGESASAAPNSEWEHERERRS